MCIVMFCLVSDLVDTISVVLHLLARVFGPHDLFV